MDSTYQALLAHLRATEHIESANRLLGWDQQTYMPIGAADSRGEQMAVLAGLVHERRTDSRMGDWLDELEEWSEPAPGVAANLRWIRRDYEKLTKLPKELVEALARATVAGQQVWMEARKQNDFASFLPQLNTVVALTKEKADALGYEGERYDALLDEFEPEAKTTEVASVLQQLANQLKPLIERTQVTSKTVSNELLKRSYPIEQQQAFGRLVAEKIGFDFSKGRIDISAHPFCEGVAPGDCRLTTRYDERWFSQALFGIMHEAGHGMYEQGLLAEHFGAPIGQYLSLGFHESQSRLWENIVGRSREFWLYFLPIANDFFPEALADVTVDQFHEAVNFVEPSAIRVEADEATYNLHIVIRFELERALVDDRISPSDLPEMWNEKYREYLGITPESDALGVLQDVHWSAGLIGYFPTYALGNIYAAQMFEVARRHIPELADQFAQGSFRPLLAWLRDNVHSSGRLYTATELIHRIAGGPLDAKPLLDYLEQKLTCVYGW